MCIHLDTGWVYGWHVGLKFFGASSEKKRLIEDPHQVGHLYTHDVTVATVFSPSASYSSSSSSYSKGKGNQVKCLMMSFWKIPPNCKTRSNARPSREGRSNRNHITRKKKRKSRSVNGWSRFVNSAGIYHADDGQSLVLSLSLIKDKESFFFSNRFL